MVSLKRRLFTLLAIVVTLAEANLGLSSYWPVFFCFFLSQTRGLIFHRSLVSKWLRRAILHN